MLLENDDAKMLLIQSGKQKRYWAYVSEISWEKPNTPGILEYYDELLGNISTWFKVTRITEAEKGIMGKCIVASSREPLSGASKKYVSFFVIEV